MSKPKVDKLVNIPLSLIKDLLTESEIRMVKQRFLIINLLGEGLSVRQIAERVGVGTDTVVRVSKMARSRNLLKIKTQVNKTPWVFGKSE